MIWVVINNEEPSGVCYGSMGADTEASCKWVLDHMQAEQGVEKVFGFRNDPEAEVFLPWTLESRECSVS